MPFICETCKKTFKARQGLQRHAVSKRPCKPLPLPLPSAAPDVISHVTVPVAAVPTAPAKPFLKWVGGKTQILDAVLARFPNTVENYYEPFVGGGSVLLGFLTAVKNNSITLKGKVYASDLNGTLIGLYKNIQNNVDGYIAELKSLCDEFAGMKGTVVNRAPSTLEEAKTSQESYYYWIREQFNTLSKADKTTIRGSAMFLFLNKTCFRGLYREGPHGFNVPFGHYANPSVYEEAHLRSISALIKDVVFTAHGFGDALVSVAGGDFAYLDPPYAPESETSFVGYTADGFGPEKHKELFKLCVELHEKGAKLLMSNADVKIVKDAFKGTMWGTHILECRRAINSKKPESKTNEVLIHN